MSVNTIILSAPTPRIKQKRIPASQNFRYSLSEEYGVSVAFLALGIATWHRTPDDVLSIDHELNASVEDGGRIAQQEGRGASTIRAVGKSLAPIAAPVLLRSVELTVRPGSLDGWELSVTGEAQINPVLIHVVASHGARIDEEEILEASDDTTGDVDPIFEHLVKACSVIPGFRVDDRRMLGAFSYLKQPMVADCEDIEALVASELVAALAGDDAAIASVRTSVGEVDEADPDYKPVEAEHLVVDADASQSFVVNAALAGRSLVVQGPPGTGKSQTIANVIACLVADSKRVLFVAQKRAAITAVLDRLEAVGLADLTLDLFAAGSSRRYVAEQLRQVMDHQGAVGAPVTGPLHRSLTASRDRLVSHRDGMHTRQHAWGVTVAELIAQSYSLPKSVSTSLRLPLETLRSWGPNDLEAHAVALTELASWGGLLQDRLSSRSLQTRRLKTPTSPTGASKTTDRSRSPSRTPETPRASSLRSIASLLANLGGSSGTTEAETNDSSRHQMPTCTTGH